MYLIVTSSNPSHNTKYLQHDIPFWCDVLKVYRHTPTQNTSNTTYHWCVVYVVTFRPSYITHQTHTLHPDKPNTYMYMTHQTHTLHPDKPNTYMYMTHQTHTLHPDKPNTYMYYALREIWQRIFGRRMWTHNWL